MRFADRNTARILALVVATFTAGRTAAADEKDDTRLQLMDVFQLEYASDPRISPDGKRVVYVRNFMDIMKDKRRSTLWIVDADGSNHRPLTSGNRSDAMPRWSPDGKRLLYVSSDDDSSAQIFCRWMDSGETAKLTNLTNSPGSLVWSQDGKAIALSLHVPDPVKPFVTLPSKPEGAEWAEPAKVIRRVLYRHDGRGYLKHGYSHLFVLPAEGGTPRQLTSGKFDHRGTPSWTPDGKALVFSANRGPDPPFQPRNSDVFEVSTADRRITRLTDRNGPDSSPVVSPDGRKIAYTGFDDRQQGYQVTRLYVMNRDGANPRMITGTLDRDVRNPVWGRRGDGVFFQYDDRGNTKIGYVTLDGKVTTRAENLGGVTIGRPYTSGSFSVSRGGTIAFTQTRPDRPADVAVRDSGTARRITALNDDLLAHKTLGNVEEVWYASSHDDRKIQGWIVTPPGFDPGKKYPFIMEIHGGPFANYGNRFTTEVQLYAAAGYVVFFANPRGSTSYGEAFGSLIHHAYPGHDYDDLMSGVDAVLRRGYVDEKNLFVTGGSGGGVLTSWIVGKTGRFAAAVAAKPVINWYSFALTSDVYPYFCRYWFPGYPWDHPEHYLKRSSLSLVGNVKTPTMLLTGESDHRTPISESEQYYQALKLRKVPTVLVRIPGASHNITGRPSQMIAKVANVLAWFEKWDDKPAESDASTE